MTSRELLAKTIPVNPPKVNKKTNPIAQSIGVSNLIEYCPHRQYIMKMSHYIISHTSCNLQKQKTTWPTVSEILHALQLYNTS